MRQRYVMVRTFLSLVIVAGLASTGAAQSDPVQERRDRMAERARQAYERILAAQTVPLAAVKRWRPCGR